MLTVEEALEAILGRTRVLPEERVPLLAARNRILAEEVFADSDVPPFDNSAVDGYAVRAADTRGAGPERPVVLVVKEEILAGAPPKVAIGPGTAARIMTGAPLPSGADAIVMVEDTQPGENGAVRIREEARAGQHVRRAGEDMPQGTRALRPGSPIRPAEIALLATLGRAHIRTYRQARVAVISTGDEVIEIEEGAPPPPGKIRNSNRYALAALVEEAGAVVHAATHIPDDPEATEAVLRECARAGVDAIVTAGGVSVGDRDYVKPALEKLGTLALWRVAMRPGKPLAFGSIAHTLFFGLPGNPVSALVTFELFVRPALWKFAGVPEDRLARPKVQAVVTETISHTPGRREYVRAFTSADSGEFITRPTGGQGSGNLHTLALANSLLIVPADSLGLRPGDTAEVVLLL